jgi:hypothetical protein
MQVTNYPDPVNPCTLALQQLSMLDHGPIGQRHLFGVEPVYDLPIVSLQASWHNGKCGQLQEAAEAKVHVLRSLNARG